LAVPKKIMGICIQRELTPEEAKKKAAKNHNKKIEKVLINDRSKDQLTHKILLLGAGASGKSTIFKQMHIIYLEGFPEKDRLTFAGSVHNNVMHSIIALCQASERFSRTSNEYKVADGLVATKKEILQNCDEETPMTEELGKKILDLWADPGIQKTFENSSKFLLHDSTSYFFNRLSEIALPEYIPTQQDVLRTRVPTTGIVEMEFVVEDNFFKMVDVGGQRSERKKWIHCFEKVTAVLFVASISAYNQVLFEENTVNRMEEALTLFEEISNNEWFENSAMILFLNKSDLLKEKIEQDPLSKYFKDYVYTGIGTKYEEAEDFIIDLFEAKCLKNVITHVTVATDSNNILYVFNAVRLIIVKKGLENCGLT